jgi:hypothetical protein
MLHNTPWLRREGAVCTGVELAQAKALPYEGMELHFTPEQEAEPAQVATREGADAEQLVKKHSIEVVRICHDARDRV